MNVNYKIAINSLHQLQLSLHAIHTFFGHHSSLEHFLHGKNFPIFRDFKNLSKATSANGAMNFEIGSGHLLPCRITVRIFFGAKVLASSLVSHCYFNIINIISQ